VSTQESHDPARLARFISFLGVPMGQRAGLLQNLKPLLDKTPAISPRFMAVLTSSEANRWASD
jgi:hypothetical protein